MRSNSHVGGVFPDPGKRNSHIRYVFLSGLPSIGGHAVTFVQKALPAVIFWGYTALFLILLLCMSLKFTFVSRAFPMERDVGHEN